MAINNHGRGSLAGVPLDSRSDSHGVQLLPTSGTACTHSLNCGTWNNHIVDLAYIPFTCKSLDPNILKFRGLWLEWILDANETNKLSSSPTYFNWFCGHNPKTSFGDHPAMSPQVTPGNPQKTCRKTLCVFWWFSGGFHTQWEVAVGIWQGVSKEVCQRRCIRGVHQRRYSRGCMQRGCIIRNLKNPLVQGGEQVNF